MNQKRLFTMAAAHFRVVMKRILGFALIAFAVHVPAATSFAEEPFTVTSLGDYGNVTVMEVSGNYDELTPEGEINSLPRELIAQEFYATHKDDYDFLAIFSNFDFKLESEAVAFYLGVKNDTLGIGPEIFDNGYLYGSGGRLQGTIDMGNIAKMASSPVEPRFDFTLDTLAHEMLHRWAAHVRFRDSSGELSTALLGKDGSHWSYLLDTKGSVEYGNNWEDNGDGTFTSIAARKYFSPLDLYLMGMIDSSEVPPMLLIENPSIDPTKVSSSGDTISGSPRYVTIEDIIAAEGERVPNAEDAQKQFKMAFILVTSGTVARDELYGIENIRKGFLSRFSILTDGQGLVQIETTTKEGLAVNPGVQPVETTPRTLPPSMDDGVSWLLAAQNEDGSWGELRTAERDTAKVVTVLENLSLSGPEQALGLQWIAQAGAGNTDYLSAKIAALSASGQDFSAFMDSLPSLQNPDGGWGSDRGFLSNPIDTCSALKALLAAYSTSTAVGKGVDYLLARQNPDGGWGFQAEAASNVLVTAEVSAMLQGFPSTTALVSTLNKATGFLLSHQNVDGGFGSSPSTVYEAALAYRALFGVITDATVLREAINYISSTQSGDGSWSDAPYSTALAVEALQLAATQPAPAPAPSPTTATVTGAVVDGMTQQSLAGATIVLRGDSSLTVETEADGSFSLPDAPPGTQTVEVSLDGYASSTQSADITEGSIVALGTISLSPIAATGIIKGVITAAATGEPLAGVNIALTGSYEWNGLTQEDGSFSIGDVTPGSITLTASKEGYETATASGTVTGGSVLSFNAQLNALTPLPTTGSVVGTVLDAATIQPLRGVAVGLQSDPAISAQTDSEGRFVLKGLPKGSQQIEFALSGYASTAIGVSVSADSTLSLGTVTLSANPSESAIRGTVSDASNGVALAGATVTISGVFNGTSVTGADGGFAVSGISPGAVTVTASKAGYYPVTVSGTVAEGGELFLNPKLSLIPPQTTTGSMTGKIVDVLTNDPLAGVTVTLQGDASISATSNTSGDFTLTDIPSGTQQVDFSLQGYTTSSITLDISAGALVDIGNLPLAASPTTGTIKGTITDAAGGEPLSGVTVTVAGAFSGSVVTGPEGYFEFPRISPGSVVLAVSKPGYSQANGTGTVVAGGVLIFSPQLEIIPPQPTTGTVIGKLVDASTSQPLNGVSVTVENNPDIHFDTDTAGSFVLSDVPAGLQDITFSLSGYVSASAKVEVAGGFVIDLGTLPLSANPTAGVLKGTVSDAENGQSVKGATIVLSGSFDSSAVTGADGTFLFPEVPAGGIAITISKAGYYPMSGKVTVLAGSVLFFNIQVTPIPPEPTTGSVMGRIVDGTTNEPLSGVSVTLGSDPSITAITDPEGGFALPDIPPGDQELDFSLSGYANSSVTIELQAGLVANLGTIPLFSNPTKGMVRGTITAAADGQPLAGVTVTLSGSFNAQMVTTADGSYAFDEVTPGSITITAEKDGYYAVAGTGTVSAGTVLFFSPRLITSPPKSSTGTLTGKVVDAMTSQPIPGAIVSLEGGSSVGTDAQGIFLFDYVAPGAYHVMISAEGHVAVHYSAMISEGVTTNMQTIYLTPVLSTTTVAGRVMDALNGTPIEGADVVVAGTDMSAKTDSDGHYGISGINSLEFYLKASATGYDSLVQDVSSVSFGFYSVDMPLNPSQLNSLKLVSLGTDARSYGAYSPVSVSAEVLNSGTQSLKGTVSASIIDADGRVVDYLQATFVDENGEDKDLYEFQPGISPIIRMTWETKNQAPGTYQVVVKVTEGEAGVSFGKRVVAERATVFTIEVTEAVESLDLTPMPRFANFGATEQVGVQASLVNRSNVPVLLDVGYEWRSPSGLVLHEGSGEISMLPAEVTKSVLLDTFAHTFAESGDHPIQVEVGSGPPPGSLSGDSISVAPGTRVEVNQSLEPSTVIPDGDKRLRMNIHLKGVVLK